MATIPFVNLPNDPSNATLNGVIAQINQAIGSLSQGASGLSTQQLKLLECKNITGTTLAATAGAGVFGMSITLGTSAALVSEAANNNTKTDSLIQEFVLPQSYVAGSNFHVTANISVTGSGTLSVETANILVYREALNGTQGANLVTGGAQNITNAGADIIFPVTGTTLSPGDKIFIELTVVLTETASSNMVANVNSLRVGP